MAIEKVKAKKRKNYLINGFCFDFTGKKMNLSSILNKFEIINQELFILFPSPSVPIPSTFGTVQERQSNGQGNGNLKIAYPCKHNYLIKC